MDCAICQKCVKNNKASIQCSHEFNFQCIEKWSKIKNECPLCRLKFNEIKANKIELKIKDVDVLKKEFENTLDILNIIEEEEEEIPSYLTF